MSKEKNWLGNITNSMLSSFFASLFHCCERLFSLFTIAKAQPKFAFDLFRKWWICASKKSIRVIRLPRPTLLPIGVFVELKLLPLEMRKGVGKTHSI